MEQALAHMSGAAMRRLPVSAARLRAVRAFNLQNKGYICTRCRRSFSSIPNGKPFAVSLNCRKSGGGSGNHVLRRNDRLAQSPRYQIGNSPSRFMQKRGAMQAVLHDDDHHDMHEEHHDPDHVHHAIPTAPGPMRQYEEWVHEGRLRDDDHQRHIIDRLQRLHDQVADYHPPKVVFPETEELKPPSGLLASIFHSKSSNPYADQDVSNRTGNVVFSYDTSVAPKIFNFSGLFHHKPKVVKTDFKPEETPLGLYLHGDVGSGKTMLMNMFYHTLPENITHKKRIHFNQFMQDVHRRMHQLKMEHGGDFDALPQVAAEIADSSTVLCFDEFQCTDVADAMILRRLLEQILSHGVVMIATSNRHPRDLYKNGIQRESFIPCIKLLQTRLEVVNLDSPTDYRKITRPPSGVYHVGLNEKALSHVNKWFSFLGDPKDPPHSAQQMVWGRPIKIPSVSGRAAKFSFLDICGKPMSAADYLELSRNYDAFIVTDVPAMDINTRDMARRFITFIDVLYEAGAALVLTTEVPISQLFIADATVKDAIGKQNKGEQNLQSHMRQLMDDLGMSMDNLKESSIFTGDEERFAFARALSRLSEMSSSMWVENRSYH